MTRHSFSGKGQNMGNDIASSSEVAASRATALHNAAKGLTEENTYVRDTSTTVAGNANAHAAIELESSTANEISAAFIQAASNLQTVASEFITADQKAAAQTNRMGGSGD